jgi:hypothetical protein
MCLYQGLNQGPHALDVAEGSGHLACVINSLDIIVVQSVVIVI